MADFPGLEDGDVASEERRGCAESEYDSIPVLARSLSDVGAVLQGYCRARTGRLRGEVGSNIV